MAPVEMTVNRVNIQRQTRSMTIAANFHSLQISSRTPSLSTLLVRNLTSLRTSISRLHSAAAAVAAVASVPRRGTAVAPSAAAVCSACPAAGVCRTQSVSSSGPDRFSILSGSVGHVSKWLAAVEMAAVHPVFIFIPVMLNRRKSSLRSRTLAKRLLDEFC